MRSDNQLPPLDLIFLMTARAICLRDPLLVNEIGQAEDARALLKRPIEDYEIDRMFSLRDLMQSALVVMSRSWIERWPTIPPGMIDDSIHRLVNEGRFKMIVGDGWKGTDEERMRLELVHVPIAA